MRPDPVEVGLHAAAQRLAFAQRLLTDALAFEVVPDELVGVEFGGVAGEKVQLQAPAQPLHVVGDDLGAVCRVPIQYQEDAVLASAHEAPEQFNERRGIEPVGVDLEPELTACSDGGDGIHALALSARGHFRRLTAKSPGAAQNRVGSDPGLIQEKELGSQALGPCAQARENLLLPLLNGDRITLVSATQGLLRGNVPFRQQPPHGSHSQPDPEFLLDQLHHDLPRPQAKVKTILARITAADPTAHLQFLLRRKRRLASRVFARLEGLLAAAPLRTQPSVDRRAAQAIALDDRARAFAFAHTPNRHHPNGFRCLMRERATVNLHPAIILLLPNVYSK